MIGLDTNVLLRLILQDDAVQAATVAKLLQQISEDNPAFISLIVLVELTWVLRNREGFSRKNTADIIANLLDTREFKIEHEEMIFYSFGITDFSKVDIADWLISISGKMAGCKHTVTFDIKASRSIPSMELLT